MGKKYLAGICSYNEGPKIKRVLERFNQYDLYDVVVIDDGSTDGSLNGLNGNGHIKIIRNEQTKGAGFGTRQLIDYARENGYEGLVFVSGNDKDDPKDVAKLIHALDEGYDLVQGSRYLPGGSHGGMPVYRRIATQWVHPVLFSILSGQKITDSTNGFRALKLSMFKNSLIKLNQEWLDQYELEPYLFFRAIKDGFKVKEVPVSKIYPPKSEGYTKMKPFVGWWSILRPLVFLALRIKK